MCSWPCEASLNQLASWCLVRHIPPIFDDAQISEAARCLSPSKNKVIINS